jgi:predicted RND superfamily exporter protein
MKKEWLIRTKNNHILGPVSISKVKELFESGSIKPEDEVSCGNGYWFYVREKELINKYILDKTRQGFNPVTEADTVLAQPVSAPPVIDETSGSAVPVDSDLEYPDMDMSSNNQSLDELKEKEDLLDELREKAQLEDISLSEEEILNNVLSMSRDEKIPSSSEHIDPVLKNKNKDKVESIKANRAKVQNSFLNQNVLYIIAGTFFILALLGFYFRKSLVKEFIEAKVNIISPVYAQVIPSSVKKK